MRNLEIAKFRMEHFLKCGSRCPPDCWMRAVVKEWDRLFGPAENRR